MSVDLPSCAAILVVDVEKFSRHTDDQQHQLAEMIPDVLGAAFGRCGLVEVWDNRRFPDSTGDGYMVGFDAARLPDVVDKLFDALQAELAGHARTLRGLGMRLRMRAGLTVGPVREPDDMRLDSPVGTTMIDNHRLVDSPQVRALLDHSDPEVTFLAVILSEAVVDQAVVKGGYARLRASQFVKLPVEVSAKQFTGTAYLRVPEPSGELLALGLLGVQQESGGQQQEVSPNVPDVPTTVSIGTVHGVSGVVGSVGGSGNTITGGNVTLGHGR